MEEFEIEVRMAPVDMSWNELHRFAEAIEQVQDCLIVGVDRATGATGASQVEDDTVDARLVIEADDSTTWDITSPDALLLERIANRLGVR